MSELKGVVSTSNVPCIEVTWKTPNVAQTSRNISFNIRSPPFSFAEASWCLVLVPYDSLGNSDAISISLDRLNSPISEHSVVAKMRFNMGGRREKFQSNEGLVNEKKDFLMLGSQKRSLDDAGVFLFSKGTVEIFCHLRIKTQPPGALLQLPVSPVGSLDFSRGNQNIAENNTRATHSASSHPDSQENLGSNLSETIEFEGQVSTIMVPFIDVTWEIPNFNQISREIGYEVESPPFSFFQASWCLELVPNGVKYLPGHMFIGLKRLDSSVPDHSVTARMCFKSNNRKEYQSVCTEGIVDENHDFLHQCYLMRSHIETRQSLLPKGTATVFCQLQLKTENREALLELPLLPHRSQALSSGNQIIAGNSGATHPAPSQLALPNSSPPTHELHPNSSGIHNLQSEYKKLLDSEKHSDVCLKVSDEEFRAHKCILGARSSVFSAMFEHDTKEKNSGEVVIEDLDPESFPDFLQHVYAGSVDTLSEKNVFSLYRAADKYDMADLKSQCKSYMERTLSVDMFCDVMVVALRYKEDELLKVAIDFFSKNLTKIIVTVKWQIFSKEHNTEANELLIKALVPADQK